MPLSISSSPTSHNYPHSVVTITANSTREKSSLIVPIRCKDNLSPNHFRTSSSSEPTATQPDSPSTVTLRHFSGALEAIGCDGLSTLISSIVLEQNARMKFSSQARYQSMLQPTKI